jgi:hypothetical protein
VILASWVASRAARAFADPDQQARDLGVAKHEVAAGPHALVAGVHVLAGGAPGAGISDGGRSGSGRRPAR